MTAAAPCSRRKIRTIGRCPRWLSTAALAWTLTHAPNARADERDPWLGPDKALHFGVSAGLAAGSYGAGRAVLFDARSHALLVGAGLTLAVGASKELWDLSGAGDPSWRDFTWDVIGTLVGLGVAWGLDLLIVGVDRAHPLWSPPPSMGRGVAF